MPKYHYTYRLSDWLGSIIKMGVILPESPRPETYGYVCDPCPAVWFSTRPDYEPTALKPYPDGRKDTPEDYRRVGARIVVPDEVAPIPWSVYRRTAAAYYKLPRKKAAAVAEMFRQMEVAGIEWGGNPSDWWCTYQPVTGDLWTDVQICNEVGVWTSCATRVPASNQQ